MPTPDPNMLTDEQVSEIEKHYEISIDSEFASSQVPALCATVRALRQEQIEGETCEFCDDPTNDEKGNPLTFLVCGRCWNKNVAVNRQTITALRDEAADLTARLAQLEQERDKFSELADKRHDELCEARRQRDSLAANHVTYTRDAATFAVKDFRTRAVKLCRDKAAEWQREAAGAGANYSRACREKASLLQLQKLYEDPHPGYDCGGTCVIHSGRFTTAAASPAAPREEANDRLWCNGCRRYLDDDHPCVCPPSAAPREAHPEDFAPLPEQER